MIAGGVVSAGIGRERKGGRVAGVVCWIWGLVRKTTDFCGFSTRGKEGWNYKKLLLET